MSEAEQVIASDLFSAGNSEFAESRFAQALAIYDEAIKHWDHPAIRYNMAICQMNQGQLVEARYNLERSLMYGAAALDSDRYQQGLANRKQLDTQLARVIVRCREQDAQVTLNGKLLFIGPGEVSRFVLPGEHQLVVTKRGVPTASRTFALAAGKLRVFKIELDALSEPVLGVESRRFTTQRKIASATAAASAVTAAGAIILGMSGSRFELNAYKLCPNPSGCADANDANALIDRSRDRWRLATIAYGAAGATAIASVVLWLTGAPGRSKRLTNFQVSSEYSGVAVVGRF